jgi:hypothetical protein
MSAWVRPALRGALGCLLGFAGCVGGSEPASPAPAATPSRPPTTTVSPDDPAALAKALASGAPRIELRPGVHRPGDVVRVGRPTELFGSRAGGGARLYAHVIVTSGDVAIHDLQLRSGVALRFAGGVTIETATITAGGQRDALNLVESRAELTDVNLESGRDGGLFATGSTVTWTRGGASGGLRSVRVDGGRFTGAKLELDEARLTGLWVDQGARATLTDVRITTPAADGMALQVTSRAALTGRRVRLEAAGAAAVAREAEVELSDLAVRHGGQVPAFGVAGATVTVRRAQVEAGPGTLASVGPYRRLRGRLELTDVVVEQSKGGTGVTVGRGALLARRVRFVGGGPAPLGAADADAAVLARGPSARVRLEDFAVEAWPGLGGLFVDDASARIETATITSAAGGFAFENVRAPKAHLHGVYVAGCVSDPAFGFLDSAALVRTATVASCPPGGVTAGGGSRVTAEDVHVRGGRFGFGAFDGGELTVRGGSVRGAAMGAVAGCISDAWVILNGTETSTLPVARCR